MCLSGRCSSCQHSAIDAGINHHDLHSVVRHNQSIGRIFRHPDDKPDPVILDLTDDEVINRMGRAMKYEPTDTIVLTRSNMKKSDD